jgi:hypothetical protein
MQPTPGAFEAYLQLKSGGSIAITQGRVCRNRLVTTTYDLERVDRVAKDGNDWLVPTGLGVIGGAGIVLGAGRLLLPPDPMAAPESPQDRETEGFVALGIGGGCLVTMVAALGVLAYQRRTTIEEAAPSETSRLVELSCEGRKAAGVSVTIQDADGVFAEGQTDGDGLLALPDGLTSARALRLLKGVRAEVDGVSFAVTVRDASAWRLADAVKTVEGYRGYLARFPNGTHANDATSALGDLLLAARQVERAKAGREALDSAKASLESGQLEAATGHLSRARGLGAEDSSLAARLTEARHKQGAAHLAAAWMHVRADDPDKARAEEVEARGLDVSDEKLEAAISTTPTSRRRAAAEEQAERDAKRASRLAAVFFDGHDDEAVNLIQVAEGSESAFLGCTQVLRLVRLGALNSCGDRTDEFERRDCNQLRPELLRATAAALKRGTLEVRATATAEYNFNRRQLDVELAPQEECSFVYSAKPHFELESGGLVAGAPLLRVSIPMTPEAARSASIRTNPERATVTLNVKVTKAAAMQVFQDEELYVLVQSQGVLIRDADGEQIKASGVYAKETSAPK